MESTRRFTKKHLILILIVVLLALSSSAYAMGYRIEPGGFARVGTVTLTNVPVGTSIYVEQVLRTTVKTPGNVSFELVPGHHSIIVSAPNDYPWSSVVMVGSGAETKVDPILVQMNVVVTPILGPDATPAMQAIVATTMPDMKSPLAVANGCAHVYVSDNQLIEEVATSTSGCTPPPYLCIGGSCEPTIIFSPLAPITNVFPYPGRQDALAIVFGGTLYVIALDPTTPQFFAPLIRGTNTRFGQLPDGTIVINNGGIISKLGL